MSMIVAGVGLVPTELTETDSVVVHAYQAQVTILQNILSKGPNTLTAADANSASQALINLQSLASSGLPATHNNADGVPTTQTYRMTADMARQTDLLFRSMMAAGIAPGSSISVTQLQRWQDLGVEGIQVVVGRAMDAIDTNRSLQALIETEYIATGNDVLAAQLTGLQTAMSTTQAIIGTLTDIQAIRNKLAPEHRSGFSVSSIGGGVNAAEGTYNKMADSAYKNPINPIVDFGGQNPQDVIAQLVKDRAALASELSQLDKISPPQIGSTGKALYDPNSLQGKIAGVLSDMTTYLSKGSTNPDAVTFSGLQAWLIDNLDKHLPQDSASVVGLAGKIQQAVDGAIQAATNLNDTQKEQFRRYMFVFEEFYKSASAMMSQINQILATMAQHISQ